MIFLGGIPKADFREVLGGYVGGFPEGLVPWGLPEWVSWGGFPGQEACVRF